MPVKSCDTDSGFCREECFVHEVTPGVVERMTLVTMLPDGPHASLRSDWAGAVEEVTPIPSPLSLFSFMVSALPLSALTLGVVYDSKELSSPERTTGYSILGWELVSHSFL